MFNKFVLTLIPVVFVKANNEGAVSVSGESSSTVNPVSLKPGQAKAGQAISLKRKSWNRYIIFAIVVLVLLIIAISYHFLTKPDNRVAGVGNPDPAAAKAPSRPVAPVAQPETPEPAADKAAADKAAADKAAADKAAADKAAADKAAALANPANNADDVDNQAPAVDPAKSQVAAPAVDQANNADAANLDPAADPALAVGQVNNADDADNNQVQVAAAGEPVNPAADEAPAPSQSAADEAAQQADAAILDPAAAQSAAGEPAVVANPEPAAATPDVNSADDSQRGESPEGKEGSSSSRSSKRGARATKIDPAVILPAAGQVTPQKAAIPADDHKNTPGGTQAGTPARKRGKGQ